VKKEKNIEKIVYLWCPPSGVVLQLGGTKNEKLRIPDGEGKSASPKSTVRQSWPKRLQVQKEKAKHGGGSYVEKRAGKGKTLRHSGTNEGFVNGLRVTKGGSGKLL